MRTPFDPGVSLDAFVRDIPREEGLRACRDALVPVLDPRAEALLGRIGPFLRSDADRGEVLAALGHGLGAPAVDPWKARAFGLIDVLYAVHGDLGDRAGPLPVLAADLAALDRLATDPASGCTEATRARLAAFLSQLPGYRPGTGADPGRSRPARDHLGYLALQLGPADGRQAA